MRIESIESIDVVIVLVHVKGKYDTSVITAVRSWLVQASGNT